MSDEKTTDDNTTPPASPTPPAPPNSQGSKGEGDIPESSWVVRGLILAIFITILIIFIGLYNSEGKFLLLLRETDVSRGLITFLVAIVTVLIALIISVWVVASNAKGDELKERFSYSKDVLATLVGILGTILGFYFGSGETVANTLMLADVRVEGDKAVAHVAGGVPPYRYSISFGNVDSKSIKISPDGWIVESLPGVADRGEKIKIVVIDSKDRSVSVIKDY